MSEEENKDKPKRGFAAHPENINRGGRPKGSRNKSTLVKAQLELDDMSLMATELLKALMQNDKDTLGLNESEDVPLKLRMDAAKEALNKAIANEKDKDSGAGKDSDKPEEVEDNTPIFSPKPVKTG